MWGQIKVVPWGARTVKVVKSKYKLTRDEVLPNFMMGAYDNAQEGLLTLIGK